MTRPHENWFYFATQDLAFARSGLDGGFYAHVCFLSQQAVEKAMKGYLVFKGIDYPKTHGLITLYNLMNVTWLEKHLSSLKKISGFYVPLRYPDALAGTLPEGLPDKKIAAETMAWAEEIVGLITENSKPPL